MQGDGRASIYIHVPFCSRLCPYCDFAVTIKRDIPHREYANAVLSEFAARKEDILGRTIQTIYFGGGTPSLWDVHELQRVLEDIFQHCEVVADAEVTLEANPNQINQEALQAWKRAGVNRLSIGCQSFQPQVLKVLRRNHSAEDARRAVEVALEVFGNVSLDLMFGVPGQSFDDWERDLDVLSRLRKLVHVSAYNLTIEPGTSFALYQKRGRIKPVDDARCASMMQSLVSACETLGLERYEVSNFARPGFRSRHNKNYWLGGEYLGLGVGAHSFAIDFCKGIVRRANPRHYASYIDNPAVPAQHEVLSSEQHFLERLFLGVRTKEGLDFQRIRTQFEPFIDEKILQQAYALLLEFCARGFLHDTSDDTLFYPTERGFLFADSIAERIYDVLS